MWRGQITFETPMLFALGFLVTFLFGGLTGVLLAAPPIDFHVSDTYFVVAHFHYVLFGTIVFATYAGIYFWFPKMTGRMLDETPRQGALLAHLHRLPHHVPGAALAGQRGHAPPLRRLPAHRRLHHAEHDLHRSARSSSAPRRCRSSGTSSEVLPVRRDRHGRRPVGLRQLAGVGDQSARRRGTTSPAAAHPLRAPGVRAALPAPGRAAPARGARRRGWKALDEVEASRRWRSPEGEQSSGRRRPVQDADLSASTAVGADASS